MRPKTLHYILRSSIGSVEGESGKVRGFSFDGASPPWSYSEGSPRFSSTTLTVYVYPEPVVPTPWFGSAAWNCGACRESTVAQSSVLRKSSLHTTRSRCKRWVTPPGEELLSATAASFSPWNGRSTDSGDTQGQNRRQTTLLRNGDKRSTSLVPSCGAPPRAQCSLLHQDAVQDHRRVTDICRRIRREIALTIGLRSVA